MIASLKSAAPLATARPDLDQTLARLRAHADAFARSPIAERIAMLHSLLAGYVAVAEESVVAGCVMKGIDPASPLSSEEWFAGPTVVVRNLRLLIETLERIGRGESSLPDGRVRTRPDGRAAVDVFPASGLDKLLFGGFSAEVLMKPGVKADEIGKRAAAHYHTPAAERRGVVSLILGAGNVASIPPTDALYKMFVEGKVCLVKMNPVNAHVGPFMERAFAAAVEAGVFAVCYGGGDIGAYLVDHAEVDEIHITGSDKTHDLLVWGPPGADKDARIAKKEPKLKKEITSELGNVSPVIVVPGPYTDGEIRIQGQSITAAVVNNASFNCNSAKLLVQPRGWPGREKLRQAMVDALKEVPPRKAYYPGAADRWNELVGGHDKVEKIGAPAPDALAWALIPDVDPAKTDDKVFHMEPWCGVISETAIGSDDPVAFLEAAVKFCNEQVWGTLSATLIVHPDSLRDPKVAAAVDKALVDLRYGTVGVNHWPALGFAFGTTPWGAFPGSTAEDIQSGRGWVHNTFMLNDDDIEKVIVRGPLVAKPKPVWFAGHKTANQVGRRMVKMEAAPSFWKLPGLVLKALGG